MDAKLRQLFPITDHYVYLNHAAITPYSQVVANSLHNIVNDITNNGSVNWQKWQTTMHDTRSLAAQLVNTQPHNIAFMRNTSDAISTIANGLPWQPGDNVVSCNIEFPANIYPWMRLQDYGVELRLAPATGGRILPSDLFALVDNRTKAIAISWVQFSSGFRADLATIGQFCRRHKIFFFVDAIQGLGALQLDVNANNIDAFAADAHKFLTGPEGIAILYLSDQALSMVKPSVVGWMSVKEWWRCFDAEFDYQLDYLPGALRFECGTPNTLGIHGFYAALQLILELTPARIEQYLLNLCDYLRQGLDRLGLEQHRPGSAAEASAIVCCRTPQVSPETLYHRLAERQIITAARGGWLRISPHFYNNQADIDKLLQALSEIIHSTE